MLAKTKNCAMLLSFSLLLSLLLLSSATALEVPRESVYSGFGQVGGTLESPVSFPVGRSFEFGSVLELSDDGMRMAVGAPGFNYRFNLQYPEALIPNRGGGAVFLYELEGSTWNLLWALFGQPNEGLGESISLSEDGWRVGIRRYHSTPSTVEVYNYISALETAFQLGAGVSCPTGDGKAIKIGRAGSVSTAPSFDDWLLVGCDRSQLNRGSVQIFRYVSFQWVPFLTLDGQNPGDGFGFAFSFVPAPSYQAPKQVFRVAISSPYYDSDRGMAQVFTVTDSASWVVSDSLLGDYHSDRFGYSIGMSATTEPIVVAGAPRNHDGGFFRGTFKVYRSQVTAGALSWVELEIPLSPVDNNDQFGRSVAITSDGGRVAVGSFLHDGGKGLIGIYDRVSFDRFSQTGDFIVGENSMDGWGKSIAMNRYGSLIASGSPGNGSVRVFLDISPFCSEPFETDSLEELTLERNICRDGTRLASSEEACSAVSVFQAEGWLSCVWVDPGSAALPLSPSPTSIATDRSTAVPSTVQTTAATIAPTGPSPVGTERVTSEPTAAPTTPDTIRPTVLPTTVAERVTPEPTVAPTTVATNALTTPPTTLPTTAPAVVSTSVPSVAPTASTATPTYPATRETTTPSSVPSDSAPTESPSVHSSTGPSYPTGTPTASLEPSWSPTESPIPSPEVPIEPSDQSDHESDSDLLSGSSSSSDPSFSPSSPPQSEVLGGTPTRDPNSSSGHQFTSAPAPSLPISDGEPTESTAGGTGSTSNSDPSGQPETPRHLESCRCDGTGRCLSGSLVEGSRLGLCVFSQSNDIELLGVSTLRLEQAEVSVNVIEDGRASTGTTEDCHAAKCDIETEVVSFLFESSSISVRGVVTISPKRRNLRGSRALSSEVAAFNLNVPLARSSDENNNNSSVDVESNDEDVFDDATVKMFPWLLLLLLLTGIICVARRVQRFLCRSKD